MTRFQAVKIYELNQLHRWIGHEGPKAPKHKGWLHPLVVVVLHYAVVGVITFGMHDLLLLGRETIEEECSTMQAVSFRKTVAAYCGWYIFLMQALRLLTLANQQAVLYEATWLCNVTLVMGPLGLYWNRPTIASAYCITIGIDQLLWYIDLLGYTMSGFCKFPIGVAKYLTWPGTSWATRITCTHHIWTIPLLLTAAHGIHQLAFPLSVTIMIANVCLSRWMVPRILSSQVGEDKYLNVNLSHELWKDISFSVLQINYDDPPTVVYLFRLLLRWQGFNFFVYIFLYWASLKVFGPAPLC